MAATKQAPPAVGVNFGDLSFYSGGFGIPPGKYALEFTVQMYDFKNAQGVSTGQAKLGVVVKAHSLSDPEQQGDKAHAQFYSMGGNADKSFAPNPDTGKGLVPVPGGPSQGLNQSTNWAIFLKSLYDCGLPKGILTNDFTTVDGIHVATTLIDEPEERKGFQSATAEVQGQPRKSNKIGVVVEILEDGKPWEGTGGIPSVAVSSNGSKSPAKAPAKVAPKSAPATQVAAPDDESALDAAIACASDVISGQIKGNNTTGKMPRLLFRTSLFSAVKAKYGDEMAQAVQNTIFATDDSLNTMLGRMGYSIQGVNIDSI